MARIFNNIFVRGLTGSVGDQFVIRKTRYGQTIIANKPRFDDNREFTDAQKEHQQKFRKATIYAKGAKKQALYTNLAKRTNSSAYNIAVADWFIGPEVLEIDISNWSGSAGQVIRILAQDNVLVTRVNIILQDGQGNSLEDGDAVLSEDGAWWEYTARTHIDLQPTTRMFVTAYDTPGNTTVKNWQYN